jgi:hypothetical protein
MAANKKPNPAGNADPQAERSIEASRLDAGTHAEMLMLYRECADSVRFAKGQQWKTLAGTLCLFVILGMVGRATPTDSPMPRIAVASAIALSVGAIYALFIYHFWQSAERSKIAHISAHLSSLLRQVRALTWRREAIIHRYVLLIFMIASILIGNGLLALVLAPRLQPAM